MRLLGFLLVTHQPQTNTLFYCCQCGCMVTQLIKLRSLLALHHQLFRIRTISCLKVAGWLQIFLNARTDQSMLLFLHQCLQIIISYSHNTTCEFSRLLRLVTEYNAPQQICYFFFFLLLSIILSCYTYPLPVAWVWNGALIVWPFGKIKKCINVWSRILHLDLHRIDQEHIYYHYSFWRGNTNLHHSMYPYSPLHYWRAFSCEQKQIFFSCFITVKP